MNQDVNEDLLLITENLMSFLFFIRSNIQYMKIKRQYIQHIIQQYIQSVRVSQRTLKVSISVIDSCQHLFI